MDAAGIDLGIPDHPAAFLVSYLLEIGPVVAAGMGSAAIGWRELQAWQYCTGIQLSPWQSRLLVSLSRDYLVFSKKAEEPSCMSPLSDEAQQSNNREAVARSLRIGFKALMSVARSSHKKTPGRK